MAFDLGKREETTTSTVMLWLTETVVWSAIGSVKLRVPNNIEAVLLYYESIKQRLTFIPKTVNAKSKTTHRAKFKQR
jgi:hypothetical protein